MKSNQPFNTYSLDEANTLIKQQFDAKYWLFIIQNMNYPEISFDTANNAISCPGFIPFRDLALEVVADLDRQKSDVKKCQVCQHFFDVNKEEGIFGDPEKLERFICKACSQNISARTFYENYLQI
ncbi:MAG: hypothetical protein HQL72_05385 [Magnetococcales bacterium]|nr:hypothetical protein [Magnetococcales bacterium]